jgi:hypothetical protein
MSHFVGATEKNLKAGMSKQDAFTQAAREVRKWHPDGRDLTNTEAKIRMAIPFYSWLRKSTPLIIQGLAQRPAKIMAYPRIQTALAQSLGIDASIEDPFPDDQLFPDWIRSYGMPPLGNAQAGGASGLIGNLGRTTQLPISGNPLGYSTVNPSNPMVDFFAQYLGTGAPNEPAKGLFEGASPAIRIPIEAIFNKNIGTGAPISEDVSGYLAGQIPLVSPFTRISNLNPIAPPPLAEETERAQEEGYLNKEALINWLTGIGLRGTGPYIDTSEFEAKARAKRFAERQLYSKLNKRSLGNR